MQYLGLDLGTTFSLVAYVNAQGVPALFPDYHDANEFRTPSVVHIGEEGCLVGQSVEELLEDEPALTQARFVKLELGKVKEYIKTIKTMSGYPKVFRL